MTWNEYFMGLAQHVATRSKDTSKKYCCPICRHESELRFVEVPEHRRHFTAEDGTECVEHMPAMRDYTCADCSWQWTQDVEQE